MKTYIQKTNNINVLAGIEKFDKMYKDLNLNNINHVTTVINYGNVILDISDSFIDVKVRVMHLEDIKKAL